MKSDGKRTVINMAGYTIDIINEVSNCFAEYYTQCKELATSLKGGSEKDTAKNIFDYVLRNVHYVEDVGEQKIKSPARLLADGEGDCKSMSLFVASCLRCLNIPAYFRYVSFANNNIPTHVYIVTKSGIIIDPVERVNGQPKFNYASKYFYKKDISIMQPTVISRLTGTEKSVEKFPYYKDFEPAIYSTKALNFINSEIDLHLAVAQSYIDDEQLKECLNYLDMLLVTKRVYLRYQKIEKILPFALAVVCYQWDNGLFVSNSTDENERLKRINEYFNIVLHYVRVSDLNSSIGRDSKLYAYFEEHILNNSGGLSISEAYKLESILKKSEIGSVSEDQRRTLENKFRQSGAYFSYMFIDENFINKNNVAQLYPKILLKRNIQIEMKREFDKNVAAVFDSQTLTNILRTGAIVNGVASQEAFKAKIENKSKIGNPILAAIPAILAIISGVIGVLNSILNIIKVFGKSKVEPSNIGAGAAYETDFDAMSKGANNSIIGGGSLSLPLTLALIGGAGYLLFKKRD